MKSKATVKPLVVPAQASAKSTYDTPTRKVLFAEGKAPEISVCSHLFDCCDLDNPQQSLELALRSIGFVLQWATNHGNDSLAAGPANGIGELLQLAADGTRYLFNVDEAIEAGALTAKLPNRQKPVRS